MAQVQAASDWRRKMAADALLMDVVAAFPSIDRERKCPPKKYEDRENLSLVERTDSFMQDRRAATSVGG